MSNESERSEDDQDRSAWDLLPPMAKAKKALAQANQEVVVRKAALASAENVVAVLSNRIKALYELEASEHLVKVPK